MDQRKGYGADTQWINLYQSDGQNYLCCVKNLELYCGSYGRQAVRQSDDNSTVLQLGRWPGDRKIPGLMPSCVSYCCCCSVGKEIYFHCSNPPSCINGYISPTCTVKTTVISPKGTIQDLERPLTSPER